MITMAEEARGHRKTLPSGEIRFAANQALCIYPSGGYRDFAAVGASHGGRGGRALFRHLYPDKDPSEFLATHPGLGEFTLNAAAKHDDEAEAEARASYAKVLYDSAEKNSPLVRQYLTQTRGLPLPSDIEARIRFISDQVGGGTMIVPFTTGVSDELCALHCTDLTPDARNVKEDGRSRRRTLSARRGWSQKGFIALGNPGPLAVVTEGFEKGLAALAAGAEFVLVTGGVSNTPELPPCVTRVIVGRDADEPESKGDQACWRGVVCYLAQGVDVAVTHRPKDVAPSDAPAMKDLDDVYRYDPELVAVLLKGANLEHGRLGSAVEDAILDEASGLPKVGFDRARNAIATSLLRMRVGAFDEAIQARRRKFAQSAASATDKRPRILADPASPDQFAVELDKIFDQAGGFYVRGRRVVRLVMHGGTLISEELKPAALSLEAHQHSRPWAYVDTPFGRVERDVPVSKFMSEMYLSKGSWGLPVFNGVSTMPIFHEDGSFRCVEGFDSASGFFFIGTPRGFDKRIPAHPTYDDALTSVMRLRHTFRTIPYADGPRVTEDIAGNQTDVVDLKHPAGLSESCFLAAEMTAVLQRSLPRVPGYLVKAPAISGSGGGKGQIVRAISVTAGDVSIFRTARGHESEELDKRIVAGLLSGAALLVLDNLNYCTLVSEQLAVAMSELTYDIRPLGTSESRRLNDCPFVLATGNGLDLSNDLARRFTRSLLNPGVEDAELRKFTETLEQIAERCREQIIIDVITIWRWGRQGCAGAQSKPVNRTLGSFEQWVEWVCRPLINLGCADPILSTAESKVDDPSRQATYLVFRKWWHYHRDAPLKASKIAYEVKREMTQKEMSSQRLTKWLEAHAEARVKGFVLRRIRPQSKNGVDIYSLLWVGEGDEPEFDADGDPIDSPSPNKSQKRRRST
jgi:hypothetical protein